MKNYRFDAIVNALASRYPRRAALSLLPTLGLRRGARLDEVTAAKSGKCKPACGECATCTKGKCKRKHGKRKVCKKGVCRPHASGTVCSDGACQDGRCIPTSPPSPPGPLCGAGGPCLVFVTSTGLSGNLSGLSGADTACQGFATSAGLPGTYKAWLSDSTGSPSTRFVQSTGPYQLRNGTTIAANWTDLTDGTLAAPINVTETGGAVAAPPGTWTHTQTNGTEDVPDSQECGNWTGAGTGDVGSPNQSDSRWTELVAINCTAEAHLYCFQQS